MYRQENKRAKIFNRRTMILSGIKLIFSSLLIGRLYYLQVIKSSEYRTLSDSNRIKLSIIPPSRGIIRDRNGKVLAENATYYRVLMDTDRTEDKEEALFNLSKLINTDKERASYLLRKVRNWNSRQPLLLYDSLSWEQVAAIEVNITDLPGIFVNVAQIRYYPYKNITSHLIGYVSAVSNLEMEKNNALFNHPDFKIGKNGIEKQYENLLRGQAGIKRVEVNAKNLTVRELSTENSAEGTNLNLSIDIDIQEYAYSLLEDKNGAVVLMDISNGNVMAMCSTPTYDNNQFVNRIDPEYWQELQSNNDGILINKAISNTYPPGSTFKMVVALAALEAGIITQNHIINCDGYIILGNRHFHCWKKDGHGPLNLLDALARSCNCYFYTIARKLGIEKISEMALMLGLGQKSGIDLPGELPGLVANPHWKRKVYKSEWTIGDTLNCGVGQGAMLITPLQLATLVSRIASGKKIIPNLLYNADISNFEPLNLKESNLKSIKNGMKLVVNSPSGTAFGSRITDPNYIMSGKTGTGQVVSSREMSSLYGKLQHHALFAGFAPFDNPRFAISVIVEHIGGGSRYAAPIARNILHLAQKKYLNKIIDSKDNNNDNI